MSQCPVRNGSLEELAGICRMQNAELAGYKVTRLGAPARPATPSWATRHQPLIIPFGDPESNRATNLAAEPGRA